jgi:hypothetical protein
MVNNKNLKVMKKLSLAIAFLGLTAYGSKVIAQTTETTETTQTRQPASQQADNSGGLSPTDKLIQAEENKSTTQRTLEGFNKGMERYEPGSSAAAAGTAISNILNKNSETNTQSSSSESSTTSPGKASNQ